MLLALLLCTAWASQAQSLTVKVNDGTALTGQGSLQAAIEASNVQLAGITSIEISAGTFNTNDWEYLKNNKTELSSLASFTITNGITSVADMPVAYTSIFNKSLTSVSVDASFAVVGMPFSGCTALTTVNLPAATSIGSYVFSGCTALTSISLPVATSVGEAAFSGCSVLATVNLPAAISIGAEAFQNCSKLTEVNLPVATSIDNYAFSNCIALSAISLPAATRIGQAAFNKCVELATVNLPAAASISYQAFSGCIKLGSISLPNTTNIEGSAFAGCAALATISLPVATSIGDYVFYNCDALSTLELKAAPPTMGSNVFGNSSSPRYLKLVAADGTPLTNNDLTEAIDAYKAHDGWDAHASTWHGWSLMHVVAATPSSAEGGAITGAGQYKPGETATLTAVPNKGYLFKQWSNGQTANHYSFEVGADVELEAQFELDHTVYPLTVKVNTTTLTDQVSLGAAVMGCGIALKDITSIEISAGTFTHNDWQFLADIRDYLNSLESFSITNGIVRVADMPNLQDGQSYFNESLTTLSIDARLTVGNFAFNNCKNLSSISLPKATSIGGNAFSGCEALIAVDLPAATEISWMAFSMCENLTMVNLPEATSIGRDAFGSCKVLTSVNLPKATSIGSDAFSFCKALTSVNLPKASSIGDGAFIFCDGLSSVSLPVATSIYFGAFRSCYGLTLMELGATPPTNVGSDVFQDCPSLRYLKLVDAEGNPLTGTTLNEAVDAYKAVNDGNTSDNLWHGWRINEQPNESITVKVNGGAEITGSSLQAIFEANNIEPASVTQLELLSGNLQGYDAAYMRTSLTALKKLTLTTATELNLRLQHSSLQEVYAPELEIVGGGAFYECTALTTVSLPKATEIGDGAFRFCFALTTVSLPAAKVIDVNAFSYSTALTFLELGGALPTVGSYAFDGCPSPRYLKLVDDEGNPLTGDGLSNAVAAYKNDDDGDTEDNLWYGWRINEQPPVQQIAIKVNGGTEITGSSLQAIFEANSIEPASVAQLEVLSGSLLGYDAGYIRSSLTALQKLTLTTATELNLRLEHGSLQEVSAPQLQTIGEGVFGGCEALTTVSLPAATEIGEWAFERCSSLISVNLPKATSIGVGAFGECSSLTTVNLPKATSIGVGAFGECSSLTTVSLPEATEIGEWAFGECSSLTSVNLPAATSIGDAAFDQCSSLTSVNLPKATEIGYGAFAQRSSLTSVNLPAATSIGMRAFAECFSLISVNLPKAVNIGEGAFEQCQSLTTVNMPEAINIGYDAFFNCESLTTVRIPKAESIDKWSFDGCYNLTFLELGATPPTDLDPQTFDDCASPRYLTVDVSAVDVYRAVKDGNDTDGLWYGWRINEQPLVQQIAIKVNGGAEITGSSLQAIIEASNIEPASVTQLEVLSGDLLVVDVAYMRCSLTALQKLTLTTTTDLNIRLQHSSLQEVYAPKLEIVGEGVFSGCYSLTSVNLPKATSIGDGAFYGCSALTSASLPAATSIGISAFYGCSALTTVSLPKVTSIRNEAFGECPALFTLELGATPPNVVGSWNLGDSPDPRSLTLVDADGNPLSGDELTDAIELYRSDAAGYLHGVWRGWSLEPLNTLIYTASEGGIIVGRAVQRLYYEQDGTTVIAVPADGYKFLRWSDDCTDNPRTDHEVRADLSVQALFEHLPYNLTYTAGVGGHIDGQLSQSVKQGENASTVKAIPADGYKFLRWSDGRTDNPRTDTNVQADLSVEAVFIDASTIVYTLTYTASDGGSIKGTATQTVVEGESGTEVEAIANEGYRFVRWSDGLTTAKRTDTNVQKNISVTAEFVQEGSNEGGDNDGGDSTGLLNISRESLSAYPNPTTGELWVSVPEPVEGTAANVLLYNVAGQLLQRVPSQGKVLIDLSGYPAGVYIIRVGNARAKVVKK